MGKAKLNIPMCAALILLLLTMISVHMTSGLYARYTSTATATDTARVAKFDVSSTLEEVKNGEYRLTVINESEVTVTYHVDVVFRENLKDSLKVTLGEAAGTWDETGKVVSFKNVETLKYIDGTDTQALVFQVQDWKFVTAGGTGEEISKNLQFDVNVTAEQVD